MAIFITRRILAALPLMLLVLLAVFLMLHALPGDPAQAVLGRHATPEALSRARREMALDKPLHIQFARHCERIIVHGDLGRSTRTQRPVVEELRARLPATIELALAAMCVAVLAGVGIGVLAAMKPKSWRDTLSLVLALTGVSIPIFWLGVMAQRFFRAGGWLTNAMPSFTGLPLSGRLSPELEATLRQIDLRRELGVDAGSGGSGFHLFDSLFVYGDWSMFLDAASHLLLPALVLASVPTAMIARITRSALGETLIQDYIRTARAKGLGTRGVVFRHALRNAALPIVTTTGTQLGYLLGGAVLTETVFGWPGMGTYIIQAIEFRDFLPVQAGVLVVATGFILMNLLVDLSYGYLDPRIRRGRAAT